MRGINELRFDGDGDFPRGTYGRAIIDGTEYYLTMPDLEVTSGAPFGIEIRSSQAFEVVHKCDCCGRFDTRPAVMRSYAEAIEKGWFVLASSFAK